MKKILQAFLLLSLINCLWAQSPWIQKKSTLLTQLSLNTIRSYNQLYLNSGDTRSTERSLTDNTFQAWFEYGLTDYNSFQLVLPIKFLDAGDLVNPNIGTPAKTSSGSLNAFGNMVFTWKKNLVKQTWLLTSNLNIEFPTAMYDDNTGLRSGYDAWVFSAALSAGRGFGKTYIYGHLGIGTRSNDYSTFYSGGLEWGYHIVKPIWVAGVLNILQSFENGTRQDPVNNLLTGLYVNDQEYIAWGLKIFGPIIPDKFGYSLALFGAFNGNFVAKAPSLNLGIYYIFSH
jgi:hypothetical protein